MVGAIAAAVALVAIVVTVLVAGGGEESVNEVFRQPAGATGDDPFTESVAVPGQDSAVTAQEAGGSTSGADLEVASAPGSQPGLYGGTQNQATCDREQLISFLEANPSKAQAWASVEGITAEEIPAFIRGLTPTRLRYDTRVTNHGYRNGQATSFQSVLQAGSAVLVDDHGLPRARCACGNPLLVPRALTGAIYQGPTWNGFSTQNVQVVVSVQTVTQFVLVDINTGSQFSRPVTSDGSDDTPAGQDGLEGTYSVTLNLTCGSELGSDGTTTYTETATWVFQPGQATLAFPDMVPISELTFDAPVVLDGDEFQITVVQTDGSRIGLAGTVADDGADFEGSGTAGQGTAASTCIVDFSGHRVAGSTSPSATTTTTATATTLPESPAGGPPCTNDAAQQALADSSIPGTVDPDHGARCEGGFAAVGILDPPYVASLAIFRADGDQWVVVDGRSPCEDRTIPYEIRVWGCNGDPTP